MISRPAIGVLALVSTALALPALAAAPAPRGLPAPGYANPEPPRQQQPSIASAVTLYGLQRPAQQHCPRDEVVWVNLASGFFHPRGGMFYERTRRGAYVCKAEATRAGFKPAPVEP